MKIFDDLKKEIEKTQVVILAGGTAKRMGKIDKPKALLELSEEKTLLDYEIELFASCGFKKFVFLLGYMHEKIIEHIERKDYKSFLDVEFSVDPTTENWGKGKAIKYAYESGKIKRERFIITFPDDLKLDKSLPLKLLLQHLTVKDKNILGTITLANSIEFPFGVARVNEEGRVTSFIEKPLVNTLTSIGLYIFEPEVLDLTSKYIDLKVPKPIEFEEVILPLLANNGQLYSLIVPHDIWIAINDIKAYEKAKKLFS
jgi:NDP-sugar pyrophosphorylase family protein